MSELADNDITYLIAWSSSKLEWIIDLTNYSKNQMWQALKGQEPISVTSLLHLGIINGNMMDDIEVHSISVVSGTKQKEIISMFNSDQEAAKNLIRNCGRKLYESKKEAYENRT